MHKISNILHKYAFPVKENSISEIKVNWNKPLNFFKSLKILALILLVQGTVLAQTPADSPPSANIEASVSSSAESVTAAVPMPVTVKVLMQTSLGAITLLIEKERAPITAANFLRYVDQKRLDGISFYRAVKIGDTGEYGFAQAGVKGDPKRVLKPIAHEPTTKTGLSHVSGAISMARLAPGTATAEFFMVLGDLKAMDANPQASGDNLGYAVFGRIIEGMDVLRAIIDQPRSPTAGEGVMKGQMLAKEIKILSVRRVE
jgi:peptidyl-prolyl cis-trans isomerase A (cyclophilin A)